MIIQNIMMIKSQSHFRWYILSWSYFSYSVGRGIIFDPLYKLLRHLQNFHIPSTMFLFFRTNKTFHYGGMDIFESSSSRYAPLCHFETPIFHCGYPGNICCLKSALGPCFLQNFFFTFSRRHYATLILCNIFWDFETLIKMFQDLYEIGRVTTDDKRSSSPHWKLE